MEAEECVLEIEAGEPETQERVGIWDHWMDADHCTVDGVEVLDGAVVVPSRLFNW